MKIELTLAELCEVMEKKNTKAARTFTDCDKCKHYDCAATEYPCKNCARSRSDYFEERENEE